jgi:hypothetical protein
VSLPLHFRSLVTAPASDTFHGHNGIKTQLAGLFHPPRSSSHHMPTVHEHAYLDTSRSANSPLTADIGFFQSETQPQTQHAHTQAQRREKPELLPLQSGQDDVTSVDGVANFQQDPVGGSDDNSTSHVPSSSFSHPLMLTLARTPLTSLLILDPPHLLLSPAPLRNTLETLSRSPPCPRCPHHSLLSQVAVQFNIFIRQRSKDSNLIVMNLPPVIIPSPPPL